MEDSRANRLSERFNTIRQTLKELHGDKVAFGAASAAWLSAIQYATRQALLRVAKEAHEDPDVSSIRLIAEMELEIEAMLQGFHKELCKSLEITQAECIPLAQSFQQVIEDICNQKG